MERPGRFLERIVASIETLIDDGIAHVQSPAYIDGRLSGSKREVDVAIISSIGSSEVLAIIEVRDRGGHQGPDWIEQVSTKRRDVGAQVAIAVSSGGFTSGAEALAAHEGIQIRTIADVNVSELLNRIYWNLPTFNFITSQSLQVAAIINDEFGQHETTNNTQGQLYRVGSDDPIEGRELVEVFPTEIWNSAEFNGNVIRIEFRLKLPRPDGFALELRTQSSCVRFPELYVDYRLTFKRERISYRKAHEYKTPDGLSYGYFEANHPLIGPMRFVCQSGGDPRPLPTKIITLPGDWDAP